MKKNATSTQFKNVLHCIMDALFNKAVLQGNENVNLRGRRCVQPFVSRGCTNIL